MDQKVSPLADRLKDVSTREIAEYLAARPDLNGIVRPDDGRVDPVLWRLRTQLGPVACLDMVPVAEDQERKVWGACIKRGGNEKSPVYGKYCFVGGVIGYGVTLADTAMYHSKVDTGLEVELPLGASYPIRINPYFPVVDGKTRNGFLPEIDKHSVGLLYPAYVKGKDIVLGVKSGIQEALGFHWFTLENAPPADQWGFGQDAGWREVVEKMTKLRNDRKVTLPKLTTK